MWEYSLVSILEKDINMESELCHYTPYFETYFDQYIWPFSAIQLYYLYV